MAVTVLNNPAGLRLKFDLGKDDSTGKTKVKSKTFSNVKHNASNEDVYEVASAIESLQQYPVFRYYPDIALDSRRSAAGTFLRSSAGQYSLPPMQSG